MGKGSASRSVILFSVLLLGAAIMFIPFYWMIATALKSPAEVASIPVRWVPRKLLWQNFLQVLQTIRLPRYVVNSLFVCSVVMLGNIFLDSLAGYALAKFDFPWFKAFSVFIIALMIIPFQIIAIPWYLLVNRLGWLNTYAALIVPESITALGIFMMRQFIVSIPDELIEAARVEGANEFLIFIRFIFPISRPAVTSLAVIIFAMNWNSFLWPLMVIGSDELKTAVVGLSAYALSRTVQYNLLMAACAITILPVVLLFAFLQKYFVSSVATSGIKG